MIYCPVTLGRSLEHHSQFLHFSASDFRSEISSRILHSNSQCFNPGSNNPGLNVESLELVPQFYYLFYFPAVFCRTFWQIYSTLVFIFCGFSIFSSFRAYPWWFSEPFFFLNNLFPPCYFFFCLFWSFMLEAFLRCLLLLVHDLEYETKEVGWKF